MTQFIAMRPSDVAQIPLEHTFDTLQSIWRPVTTANNHGLIIATLDSENLRSVGPPALQDAIAYWRTQVSVLSERAEQQVFK